MVVKHGLKALLYLAQILKYLSPPRVGYGYTNYYFYGKLKIMQKPGQILDWEFNEDVPGFRFAKVYFIMIRLAL